MRVICSQTPNPLDPIEGVAFSLFRQPMQHGVGRVAAAMPQHLRRAGVYPSSRAWDFLALALSVAAADQGCLRRTSPDGWTREIRLEVAVTDAEFWNTQTKAISDTLRFLTGDIWQLAFVPGGAPPPRPIRSTSRRLTGDCVCLLSGGADSLVGAIDAVSAGRLPVLVSQIAQGDAGRQQQFAETIGQSLSHLQLNHAIEPPGEAERSQRARSLVFVAYGVLAASVLPKHSRGEEVDLLIPENGFVSLNVPLTPLRLGTLSTRTTHPFFIGQMQRILDAVGFHVRLLNPYQLKTKGEMLIECSDQSLLRDLVFGSTSCGRFSRFNYKHCGRCVPCLVRRAAFLRWGQEDETLYRYQDLSILDDKHSGFDDVRSVAFATHRVERSGVQTWAGDALNYMQLGDTTAYADLVERSVAELREFLDEAGVN